MQSIVAGMMGFFLSITSIFTGGAKPVVTPQPAAVQQVQGASTSSGTTRGNLPQGEQRFFGTVTNVNGSTLTVQMQGRPGGAAAKSITVTSNGSTTYTGGEETDITTNTRVAGVGQINSDESLTAISVQISPVMPSGFPQGRGGHRPQSTSQ
jgi:hypothetical protein